MIFVVSPKYNKHIHGFLQYNCLPMSTADPIPRDLGSHTYINPVRKYKMYMH